MTVGTTGFILCFRVPTYYSILYIVISASAPLNFKTFPPKHSEFHKLIILIAVIMFYVDNFDTLGIARLHPGPPGLNLKIK